MHCSASKSPPARPIVGSARPIELTCSYCAETGRAKGSFLRRRSPRSDCHQETGSQVCVEVLRKAMKRYEVTVTVRLRSFQAALKEVGNQQRHETGRWFNLSG